MVSSSVGGVGNHNLPLFAIYHVYKHLHTASSQPGCNRILSFDYFTTSDSFLFDFSLVVTKCSGFLLLISLLRNSACNILLTLLIWFLLCSIENLYINCGAQ